MTTCDFTKNDIPKFIFCSKKGTPKMAHPVPAYMEVTPPPRDFAEKGAYLKQNPRTKNLKIRGILPQKISQKTVINENNSRLEYRKSSNKPPRAYSAKINLGGTYLRVACVPDSRKINYSVWGLEHRLTRGWIIRRWGTFEDVFRAYTYFLERFIKTGVGG